MLSLVELERVADTIVRRWVGGRVERWVEPEAGRVCVALYRRDGDVQRKAVLDLDARPEVAHVGELERMPGAPDALPAFAAYLRAHLSRARLESAALRGGDRQLALDFSAEEGRYTLLLSLFGRHSNLYLLGPEDRLLMALRPLRETRAELALGAPFVDPASGPPRSGEDRFAQVEQGALLAAIAARYADQGAHRSQAEQQRKVLALLEKERKTAQRRIERIEEELREADQASVLERHGELLKANLARIAPGARSVVVSDFASGLPVEIPLDPELTPRANLEAIFKRYQKLIRRLSKAGGQIDEARAQWGRLSALESEAREIVAASAPGGDESARWSAFVARDEVARLLAREGVVVGSPAEDRSPGRAAQTRARPALPAAYRDQPKRLHPRRYRTASGLEIWVGRNDDANDFLTTRLARAKDLFFHLAGAPGSHVILRTEGRADPPADALLDACELAVHFSKAKNAGSAEVHVVPIQNVRKPKGAKPGLVYVTGGRSLHLRREEARLERILAARIDD